MNVHADGRKLQLLNETKGFGYFKHKHRQKTVLIARIFHEDFNYQHFNRHELTISELVQI